MSSRDVKIRNVGPKSAAWLRQVGVRSTEDLARIGPVETFLKVKRAGFRPSLNLLYSMAGALADCHWAELPEADKQRLLSELESAESANPIRTRWEKQKAASDDGAGVADESAGDDPPGAVGMAGDSSDATDPERAANRFD